MQQRAHPSDPDLAHAVEIGERLYWVGHLLEGDPFQCHVYLVEHGRDSILIDPGSMLTFEHVRRKVEEIIPWDHIRYFVCQHPDPDIVGALPHIDQINTRDDAVIVTHWRAAALLRHLAVKIPFWKIEDHGWLLELGARRIRFVLTPYLHFPGCFATFDERTGTLFSSDLFGGFTPEPRLYAKDESYFEDIRAFHEHYMPSHDILAHGILRLRELPIEQIAPQHGSMIRGHLVPFIMDRLMNLDCGLYLLARQDTEIRRLLKLNSLLRDLMHALVVYQDFRSVALFLLEQARAVLPVEEVEFWARRGEENALSFSPSTRYRGVEEAEAPRAEIAKHLERAPSPDARTHHEVVIEPSGAHLLIVPLTTSDDPELRAVAVLRCTAALEVTSELDIVLGQLAGPLAVAIERERLHRDLERERDRFYERSIRDGLTGLYSRRYLDDAGARMLAQHDRDPSAACVLVMLDVDHFKRVNDRHGHPTGDAVLRGIGEAIRHAVRDSDVPVRYGGEEFAVLIHGKSLDAGLRTAERIREHVGALRFPTPDGGTMHVTMSGGVALHRPDEPLAALIRRADEALYRAKEGGRDRVVTA